MNLLDRILKEAYKIDEEGNLNKPDNGGFEFEDELTIQVTENKEKEKINKIEENTNEKS